MSHHTEYSIDHIYTTFSVPVLSHSHKYKHNTIRCFVQSYCPPIVCIVLCVIYVVCYSVFAYNTSQVNTINMSLFQQQVIYTERASTLQSQLHQLHSMHNDLQSTHATLTAQVDNYKQHANDNMTQDISRNTAIKQIEVNISHKNNKEKEYMLRKNLKQEQELTETISHNSNEIKELTNKLTTLHFLNSNNDDSSFKNTMLSSIITSMGNYLQLRIFLSDYMRDDVGFMVAYSKSRDTFNPAVFHKRCEIYSKTIVLIKTEFGCIFGGFTSQSWTGSGFKRDKNAFLFNFNKRKKYPIHLPSSAIYTWHDIMPIFGDFDLAITSDQKITSGFPLSYGQGSPKLELTCGFESSAIEELEVLIMFEDDLE